MKFSDLISTLAMLSVAVETNPSQSSISSINISISRSISGSSSSSRSIGTGSTRGVIRRNLSSRRERDLDDVEWYFDPSSVQTEFVSSECWNFSVGNRRQREIYSPNYGQFYPSKTDCVHLIVGDRRMRIRLDFRGEFHVESSDDCNNDMLELRDGPFGYSPLIGRFCGSRHPPLIESTGSYLWMRFHSDDSIEYNGFRAVYEYFEDIYDGSKPATSVAAESLCRIDVRVDGDDGVIGDSDVSTSVLLNANRTGSPIDCTWVLHTLVSTDTVFLRWQKYMMSTLHSCEDSNLEIYDGNTSPSHRKHVFCDTTARDFRSSTNVIYVRLYAKTVSKLPIFKLHYTAQQSAPCGGAAEGGDDGAFDCGDKTCVLQVLVCNGRPNCNTSRDEAVCNKTKEVYEKIETPMPVKYHLLIIAIVGGVIITVVILSVCAAYHQNRKNRQLRHRQEAAKLENHRAHFELTELTMSDVTGNTPAQTGNSLPRGVGGQMKPLVVTSPEVHAMSNHYESRRARKLSNGGRAPNVNQTSKPYHLMNNVVGDFEIDENGRRKTEMTSNKFEDASRLKSVEVTSQNSVISAVATIEKRPPSPLLAISDLPTETQLTDSTLNDGTPSPRPDVVQDEKYFHFGKQKPTPTIASRDRKSDDTRRTNATSSRGNNIGHVTFDSSTGGGAGACPEHSFKFPASDFFQLRQASFPIPTPHSGVTHTATLGRPPSLPRRREFTGLDSAIRSEPNMPILRKDDLRLFGSTTISPPVNLKSSRKSSAAVLLQTMSPGSTTKNERPRTLSELPNQDLKRDRWKHGSDQNCSIRPRSPPLHIPAATSSISPAASTFRAADGSRQKRRSKSPDIFYTRPCRAAPPPNS